MTSIKDKIDLQKMASIMQDEAISNYYTEKVKIEEAKTWDLELKFEILYWGKYDIGVSTLTRAYVKNQWEYILDSGDEDNEYIDNLYYVNSELSDGNEKIYIYDTKEDIVYKINRTSIGRFKVHSIKELDYLKQHDNIKEREVIPRGSVITSESNVVTVGNIGYYEPDLTGFIQEKTEIVYYKTVGEEISGDTITKSVTEYLDENGNKRTIIQEEEGQEVEYEFYNYETNKWANIKVEDNNLVSYWVWIPRYAYKIDGETIDVIYIDLNDKNAKTGGDLPEGYIVHKAFEDGKKGIWVSKYEPNYIFKNTPVDFSYYVPDMSGFNPETTYLEIYKEDGTFKDVKLADVKYNLTEFAKNNRWFDYENKIWANIKTVANEKESWWVWIPRYAYNIVGQEIQVIFIDTQDNPLTGEKLPSTFVVHKAFEGGKKGIWASKFEPSEN